MGTGGRSVKLATHLQIVTISRKHVSIHPLSLMPSWLSAYLVKHKGNFDIGKENLYF
jgi:hypothetical protein